MPSLKGHIRQIHFVGIGGVGMSGIAEVLHNRGFTVTGSDAQESNTTRHLQSLGVKLFRGHHPNHILQADVLVISSAISSENPEVQAAHEALIPVISRAEMLAELMRFHHGIAVAGTHGKTTTTSLVASLLAEGGLDPTYVIGGCLNSARTHAKLGTGKYFVAEADESDASFLLLKPMLAIVTNIDMDHMSTYGGDFGKLKQTFLDFLHHLPFYGQAILCIDDPVIKSLLPEINRPVCTYGFDSEAQIRAVGYQQRGLQAHFSVESRDCHPDLEVKLNLPGKHNVLNALAALAVAREAGLSEQSVQQTLHQFAGIGRRFQVHDELKVDGKSITLVDDYGHHPQEVKVTLAALREVWPNRRLVMVFQPHRFTRTRDLFDDFATVLSEPDLLCLLSVYTAGEEPIQGADSRSLARAIRQRQRVDPIYVEDTEALWQTLPPLLQEGDVVLFQGAGDIGKMARQFVAGIP